jgi:hypothetical protein
MTIRYCIPTVRPDIVTVPGPPFIRLGKFPSLTSTGVGVTVTVEVGVAELVEVEVGILVFVDVGVGVFVFVGVGVFVFVGVGVLVFVGAGVFVSVGSSHNVGEETIGTRVTPAIALADDVFPLNIRNKVITMAILKTFINGLVFRSINIPPVKYVIENKRLSMSFSLSYPPPIFCQDIFGQVEEENISGKIIPS